MFDQLDDVYVRDISDILLLERRKEVENARFTAKTRGQSPACLFGQEIEVLDGTMLHCLVDLDD